MSHQHTDRSKRQRLRKIIVSGRNRKGIRPTINVIALEAIWKGICGGIQFA
jgi:hypothetical protein